VLHTTVNYYQKKKMPIPNIRDKASMKVKTNIHSLSLSILEALIKVEDL
jgi:hypothetical protein